ncbi:DUF4167 domain-containing protein [Glacieibacterium frigidum]|uniref:DUF4167 domain-containing protein n=2 Tax=Glacieibacterium frigidum TaxID=2593303 RepID=A0A552UGE8_9SPHN|nr:DUF4167 domain-containing protein [Glacieibacterium frigidum]
MEAPAEHARAWFQGRRGARSFPARPTYMQTRAAIRARRTGTLPQVTLNAERRSLARRHPGTFDLIRNNNQQNGRRRGRGGGQGGGGMGGAPRPQGQNYGNNRLDIRQRGNATQLLEKYKTLARDAAQQGDRVVSEYYLQYADHYFRVLNEIRERQPENQRGPRPGYDADDDDGQDVGNGYNPAYAAQNTAAGNVSEDDGEDREYAADDNQRADNQRGDNRRDEPRAQQRDDRPRRDDQRGQQRGDGRNDRQYEPRQSEGRQYEPRQDGRQNEGRQNDNRQGEARTSGEYRRDEPRGDNRREESRRDEPRREDSRREPRQDARREDGPRDQRPRREAAERPVEAVQRAPIVEDEPMIAGLPGPATIVPEPVAPVAAAPAPEEAAVEEAPRRRRGRPRKVDVEAAAAAAALADAEG